MKQKIIIVILIVFFICVVVNYYNLNEDTKLLKLHYEYALDLAKICMSDPKIAEYIKKEISNSNALNNSI